MGADLCVSCSAEFPEGEGAVGGFEEGWGGETKDEGVEEPYEEAVGWGVYNHVIPILVNIARVFNVFERRLLMGETLLRFLNLLLYEDDGMGNNFRSQQQRVVTHRAALGNGVGVVF